MVVLQHARRLRLPHEALEGAGGDGDARQQHLERNPPVERELMRLVHDAHATARDLSHDAEVSERRFLPREADACVEIGEGVDLLRRLVHELHDGRELSDLGRVRRMGGDERLEIDGFAPAQLLQQRVEQRRGGRGR